MGHQPVNCMIYTVEIYMEINYASTLAKVLTRERALEARDRKDAAIEKGRLGDSYAPPGSQNFPQAVEVIARYLEDLVEAKVSGIREAHAQTEILVTGETVENAIQEMRTSLETVISERVRSWAESSALFQKTSLMKFKGGSEALADARRKLERQAARLVEKAEAKLDVILQSSLAASERRRTPSRAIIPKMRRKADVLSVLIASPSDLGEQREVLTKVISDWNDTHSKSAGIVLVAVKWETHAHPATGDYPQGLINKQIVDDCDIVMAAFWSRLGTATPVAASGTAEEIERLRSNGKKVLLYFSTAPLPQSHDPEQWRMLQEYQRTLQKDSLWWNFSNSDDLHRVASRHLASVIHEISAELGDDTSVKASLAGNPSESADAKLQAASPFVIPKRYGEGILKHDIGYTGLGVINDGEPAYDISISNISIDDGARLEFHRGHTERLSKSDGEAFYPAFVAMKLGGTFGDGLFDFMRERGIRRLTAPITYRDSGSNWFQTDVTLERDVEKQGGLRLNWKRKRIPDPTSDKDGLEEEQPRPRQAFETQVELANSVHPEDTESRLTVFDETKPLVPELVREDYEGGSKNPTYAYHTWVIRPRQSLRLRLDQLLDKSLQKILEAHFKTKVPGIFRQPLVGANSHTMRWQALVSGQGMNWTYVRYLEVTPEGALRYSERVDRHDTRQESVSDLFIDSLQFWAFVAEFYRSRHYCGSLSVLHRIDCIEDVQVIPTFPDANGTYRSTNAISFPEAREHGIAEGSSRHVREIVSFQKPEEHQEIVIDAVLAHLRELCQATADYEQLESLLAKLPDRAPISPP